MPSPYWMSRATEVPRLARRIISSVLGRELVLGRDVTVAPDIPYLTSAGGRSQYFMN
jgi:hypothetical protein